MTDGDVSTKPNAQESPGSGDERGLAKEPGFVGEVLTDLVYRDDLTQSRNRRFFFNYLKEEIEWDHPAAPAVSLLMIDLDHFKEINDRHGHLEGDHALVHVSGILREHVGDRGIVVRYAGDEFAVILPGWSKPEAGQVASDLLDEVRRRALALAKGTGSVSLTLSIGVATFPDDARRPDALVESADRALYASKRRGRNQVSVFDAFDMGAAADETLIDVFPCKVLIARDSTLATYRDLLMRTGGAPGADAPVRALLLVRGGIGSGKSRLLSEFRAIADESRALFLSTSLQERDARQPYAAIGSLLQPIWKGDHGPKLRETLEPEELSAVRGLLGEEMGAPLPPKAMNAALASALPRIFGISGGQLGRVILLDDLLFVDRDSLDLLLRVLDGSSLPLLVAATVRDEALSGLVPPENLRALLEWVPSRGASRYDVTLQPFTRGQTLEFILASFPGLAPQPAAVDKLCSVSGGNPLFLEALLRHLIDTRAIRRTHRGFAMGPIENAALPASLEDAIRLAWKGIDRETERILESAAVVGSRFDVELLRGMTGLRESEILECLDRAAGRKLLRAESPLDADAFVFESNRVREMKLQETSEERRAELHERIAKVEEERHRTSLEAIIGRLAYHYSLSRNQDKATFYGSALDRWSCGVTPQAGAVPKAVRARIREADSPLGDREMVLLGHVFRFFAAAIKNRTLYPPGSRIIATSLEDLAKAMRHVFETCHVFTISSAHEDLVVNGVTVDSRHFLAGSRNFLGILKDFHIRSLTVTHGVATRELEGFIDIVTGRTEPIYDPEFWDRKLDEKGIEHLSVDQRLYVVAGADATPVVTEVVVSPAPSPSAGPWAGDPTLAAALERWIHEKGVAPDLQSSIEEWSRTVTPGVDLPSRLIGELSKPEPRTRQEAARVLRGVLSKIASKAEASWMKAAEGAVVGRFGIELDPAVISELGGLVSEFAQERLRRGEATDAAHLVETLRQRASSSARSLGRDAEVRERMMDLTRGATFDLLAADLSSGDAKRQADAATVIRAMGDFAVPALVRLVREREDLRLRQLAASLLRDLGDKAIAEIRRALTASTPEQELRRALGVVDLLGADFTPELRAALVQPSRSVRQEAAQVLARLPGDSTPIFLETLSHADRAIAVEALLHLGRVRRRETVDAVLKRMHDGPEEDVLYEGCMTLGRIADPRAVAALAHYLNASRLLALGKRYPERVRYAAAWALSQFSTVEARQALKRAEGDRSALVRTFVTKALAEAGGSSGLRSA